MKITADCLPIAIKISTCSAILKKEPRNFNKNLYPDYGYNHPLFTSGMKIYSDTKVSDFLSEITADQSIDFLTEWNSSRNHSEKIYISYDSTNKSCQAGDIEIAEFGYLKDGNEYPVINYSIEEMTAKEGLSH